jgi:hypothetical protein
VVYLLLEIYVILSHKIINTRRFVLLNMLRMRICVMK